jgi:Carboxypeptidase regulatory-like domain
MNMRYQSAGLLLAMLLICLGLSVPVAWGGCGSITGSVLDTQKSGIYGTTVNVYHLNHVLAGSAMTDWDGLYSVGYLPADNYKVEFVSDSADVTGYLRQWYAGKADFTTTTPVTVIANGITPNINATLADGGSISGTVTGTTSAGGIADVIVTFYDATGTPVGETTTATDGSYRYAGLAKGSYTVRFSRDAEGCSVVWYNAKADMASADPVAVIVGQEKPSINVLLPTGTLHGTVRNAATGIGILFARVSVYEAATGNFVGYQTTTFTGSYSFIDLAPGSYKVMISTPYTSPQHVTAWYNNKFSLASADSFIITAGSSAVIDATLMQGGTISGKVTDSVTGTGITKATVYALDSATGEQAASAVTVGAGTYTLQGLRLEQSYKIQITRSGYDTQWYDNNINQTAATPVTVTAATPSITGINASLVKSADTCGGTGSITGILLDYCGAPAPDMTVTGYTATGQFIAGAITDSTGTYTLTCLPTGTYRILFNDTTGYVATADATVNAPAATPQPDVTLGSGGSIIGRVVNSAGQGIAHAYIVLFDAAGNSVGFGATTDSNGNFVAGGLPTGSYTVQATRTVCSGMESAWYGTHSPVAVTAPASISGIDIAFGVTPTKPLLTVLLAGSGSGSVTSTPTGIVCPSGACTAPFSPGTVSLAPHTTTGSIFTGWSGGGCSGTGSCDISLTADTTVTATFGTATFEITTSAGTGGSITASQTVSYGADSTPITVTPDTNYHIDSVLLDSVSQTIADPKSFSTLFSAVTANHTVNAFFAPDTRTVGVTVTGAGTVTSTPQGIICSGGACTALFAVTLPVTLTPSVTAGSLFTGWSGGGCSGTATCVIPAGTTLESTTATFVLATVNREGVSYLSVKDAYGMALDGNTIQAVAQSFGESLTLNRGITISLRGGYNSNFSTVVGSTILQTPFIVTTGKVTIANIVIR